MEVLKHGPLTTGQIARMIEHLDMPPVGLEAVLMELSAQPGVRSDAVYWLGSEGDDIREKLGSIIEQLEDLTISGSHAGSQYHPEGVPFVPTPPALAPAPAPTGTGFGVMPIPVTDPITRTCNCPTFTSEQKVCSHLRATVTDCLIHLMGSSGSAYEIDPVGGTCSCPDYHYRGAEDYICKHLRSVAEDYGTWGLTLAERNTILSRTK